MAPPICDNDRLWDSGLTWTNNSWPQLTECFRFTVLDPLACACLWLSAPIYVPYLLSRVERIQEKKSWLFKSRIVLYLLMASVQLVSIIEDSVAQRLLGHQLSASFWIATLFLSIALMTLEQARGQTRSLIHFFFWTMASCVLILQVYEEAMIGVSGSRIPYFAIMCTRLGLATLLFLLSAIGDTKDAFRERHNPQVSASPLSYISFAWMDRLMLMGSRKQLTADDIYDLNPGDKAANVITKFLENWQAPAKTTPSRRPKAFFNRSWRRPYWMKPKDKPMGEKTYLISDSTEDMTWQPTYVHDQIQQHDGISTKHRRSFVNTLFKTFGWDFIVGNVGMLVFITMNLITPFILGALIDFAKNTSEQTWHGFIFAIAFLASRILITISNSGCQYLSARLAIRVRSVAVAAIFRKALVLSSESRRKSTMGEIVNLMSVDTNYLELFLVQSFQLWTSSIILIVAVYLLYTIIGISMFAGLGFICVMLLVNLRIADRMKMYQDWIMGIKDERLRMMGEILNGIKVIKLYGWEPWFIRKVTEIRTKELKVLLNYCFADTASTFSHTAATFWMGFFMFMTYILTNSRHYLSAKTVFVTINYIALIRMASTTLPLVIRSLVKALSSVKRINKFLQMDDLNPTNLDRDFSDKLAVRISGADFAWASDESPVLTNVNLKIEPGKLVAIVGTVGAGKTSLLSALLGEMTKLKGTSNMNSSVAYVPQQAWIQNNTVRENITFGSPYLKGFYRKVIDACALKADMEMLQAGDFTEIGEKGINLSGGQKQRVSVARAVYSQADIVLLDDPLSAVDSHVGKHIFKNIIGKQGLLKDKTRLMVTHGLQWLPYVDYIVVMNKGTISEAGSYTELVSHDGPFAQFLKQFLTSHSLMDGTRTTDDSTAEEDDEDKVLRDIMLRQLSQVSDVSDTDALPFDLSTTGSMRQKKPTRRRTASKSSLTRHKSLLDQNDRSRQRTGSLNLQIDWPTDTLTDDETMEISKLIADEDTLHGKVPWKVYYHLLKAYGFLFAMITFFFVLGFHSAYNYTYIWLAKWNDDADLGNFTALPADSSEREHENMFYLTIYSILGVIQSCCCLAYSSLMQYRHVTTSRIIHSQLLENVLRAPMSFFDTTPIGRILNRFSQDLDVLDSEMFLVIEVVVEHAMFSVGIFLIISYTFPPFIGVLVPLIILFGVIQHFYVRTSCQLVRSASSNRSPVYAHFSETLSGVSVIRAHQAQARFIRDSDRKVDNFQKPMTSYYAANMWILSRLDVLSYVCVLSATIFTIMYRESVEPGLVGLSISFSLLLTNELSMVTRMSGQFETQVVSVERMREYSVVDTEAEWTIENDSPALDQWPADGRIQFVNYSTRYRPDLDLVLKGVNVTIEAGQKIGIVGRTGAGKSSMMLSLFRLIEASNGQILIDGVDIAKVGLHALRRGITILPQDPIVFAGTLRMNLDPFNSKTDEELWQALEHAHLKSLVKRLPKGLDHEMGEGGESFSMGQRQLVCLARTLVRKTKVLVLDEATAAVDMETDELIQRTIHDEFYDSTVMTIAHRINTVLDYDKIMVLQNGHLIEFASPSELLADTGSVFFSMAREAGLTTNLR